MFYYLEGTVAEILPGLAVIDCGGVGYGCMTTNNTLASLTEGNRLVGIISHVTELKERIDRQIVVTKQKTGESAAKICI